MIKKILSTLLFASLLLVPSNQALARGLYDGYALTDGTVTDIQPSSPMSDIKDFCKISYDVTIDGKDYSEKDTTDNYNFCYLGIGDTIKIKYLKTDPRDHNVASKFEIEDITQADSPSFSLNPLFFIIPFGVISLFIVGFIIVSSNTRTIIRHKMSDIDGDGLANDDKPATAEQKKLISEGFRKLGVYHEVKKGLTQAQARETLREIDNQLKKK